MITEELYKAYSERAKQLEGEKLKIYDDGHGVPTIGVGFALVLKVGNDWVARKKKDLQDKGIDLNEEQYKIIKEYEKAKSSGSGITSSLQSKLQAMDFSIDVATSNNLLRSSIDDQYNKIKGTIGENTWDSLNHARQMAVMDYCFHHGNIISLAPDLKSGKFTEVASVMRKDAANPAFAARAELRASYMEEGKTFFPGVHIVNPKEIIGGIAKKYNMKLSEAYV